MFKKKTVKAEDKELNKLAKKYKKILEKSEKLPKNSREMFRVIRKAGI